MIRKISGKPLLLVSLILFIGCKNGANSVSAESFTSERISKSATIHINGTADKVFPLFGAYEERKWAEGWDPRPIYPTTEVIEEGSSFLTPGHGHGEANLVWIVTKYEPKNFLIQYLVSNVNRYWTITVQCEPIETTKTSAKITYSFTSLNSLGEKINAHALESMYTENLEDWKNELNDYLKGIWHYKSNFFWPSI